MITLLALSSSAVAFDHTCSWPTDSATMTYRLGDVAPYGDLIDELQAAANKINANPSNASIEVSLGGASSQTLGNGINDVIFEPCPNAQASIACVRRRVAGSNCTEADLYIDPDFDWTLTRSTDDNPEYDSSADAGDYRPLLNTGIHELLHVLGLKHENAVSNIMGNAWSVLSTNNGITRSYVTEDSARGLVDLYGNRPDAFEDLALMHFERDAAASSGDYSVHKRTEIRQFSTGPAPILVSGTDEPRYAVLRGADYLVDITAENVGKSSQYTDICFYVSTNDNITTGDTLLTTTTRYVGIGAPLAVSKRVTLPSNLNIGQSYWIGAKIDCANSLSEHREKNNFVYVAEVVPIF